MPLVVIDGKYLFGETADPKQLGILMYGASHGAKGLGVESLEPTEELRAALIPWADRPDGVGVEKPGTKPMAPAPAPPAAAAPTSSSPTRTTRRRPEMPTAAAIDVHGSGSRFWCELDGERFEGRTPGEARLKAEAHMSMRPATAAEPAAPAPAAPVPAAPVPASVPASAPAAFTLAALRGEDLQALADRDLAFLGDLVKAEQRRRAPAKAPTPPPKAAPPAS